MVRRNVSPIAVDMNWKALDSCWTHNLQPPPQYYWRCNPLTRDGAVAIQPDGGQIVGIDSILACHDVHNVG